MLIFSWQFYIKLLPGDNARLVPVSYWSQWGNSDSDQKALLLLWLVVVSQKWTSLSPATWPCSFGGQTGSHQSAYQRPNSGPLSQTWTYWFPTGCFTLSGESCRSHPDEAGSNHILCKKAQIRSLGSPHHLGCT